MQIFNGREAFILPQNLEAERAVLGAILLDNALANQAVELLKPDDFYLDAHRRIYERMVELSSSDSSIDIITLCHALKQVSQLEQIGGPAYLANLVDGVPRIVSIAHHAKLIKDKSILRRLMNSAQKTIAACIDNEDEAQVILQNAERDIYELTDDRTTEGFVFVKPIGHLELERIEKVGSRTGGLTGVTTGLKDIDRLTNGLHSTDLIVLAARPGCGKTSLAMNMAVNACKDGATVGIFSLEMSKSQLVQRMMSSEGRVDLQRMRGGILNDDEWGRLAHGLDVICDGKILIDDTAAISMLEMRAKARRLKAEHGLNLLVIDYLQLMRGRTKTENRQQEVAQIARDLKAIAKELEIPVLALSQLNRSSETRIDHKPQLSDLRDSGEIEQSADLVCFIYREELYKPNEENGGLAEFVIAKHRNGPTDTVKLAFLKEFTRFENLYGSL